MVAGGLERAWVDNTSLEQLTTGGSRGVRGIEAFRPVMRWTRLVRTSRRHAHHNCLRLKNSRIA
jgi:hypothetical protein